MSSSQSAIASGEPPAPKRTNNRAGTAGAARRRRVAVGGVPGGEQQTEREPIERGLAALDPEQSRLDGHRRAVAVFMKDSPVISFRVSTIPRECGGPPRKRRNFKANRGESWRG